MPVPDNPLALNMIGWSVISPTLMGLSFMWGARTQWIGNVKKMEGTKDVGNERLNALQLCSDFPGGWSWWWWSYVVTLFSNFIR